METTTTGKVLVAAKAQSLFDLFQADRGLLRKDQIRSVEVPNAWVDAGAIYLSLPKRLIDQLGLERFGTRRVRTRAGVVDRGVYEAVRLTVQGRDCTADVLEVPDDCPVLIGQVPLGLLDFVVDPVNGKLIGNPAHGGEHIIDSF
jgi:predicted aspartyl protease